MPFLRWNQVTDVGYLILFLAVGFGMLWLDSQANTLGNVLRLSEPIDYQGRLCGYDEEATVCQAAIGFSAKGDIQSAGEGFAAR